MTKARWGWLRTTVVTILVLVAVLMLLTLSRSPATAVSRPPSSEEVDSARRVYGRVRVAQVQPGQHQINATWEELSAVAELGGRALGIERMAFDQRWQPRPRDCQPAFAAGILAQRSRVPAG